MWASFGGRRRPNCVRLREISRMVDVQPSWWAAKIGGGRRCCLVVAGGGGGWEVAGEFRRKGAGAFVGGGKNEEKPFFD